MNYTIIDNFLTPEECKWLIAVSQPRLAPAKTWNVKKGVNELSDYRVCEQMFFYQRENPVITMLESRIASTVDIPITNGEGLQIVHYREGGHYKSHWDYFAPDWANSEKVLARGGQRIITFLMYLNTVSNGGGGETYFPIQELSVEPVEGKALWWYNLKEDGAVDKSTYHEAIPVKEGEKWIMTKWIRERTFF